MVGGGKESDGAAYHCRCGGIMYGEAKAGTGATFLRVVRVCGGGGAWQRR